MEKTRRERWELRQTQGRPREHHLGALRQLLGPRPVVCSFGHITGWAAQQHSRSCFRPSRVSQRPLAAASAPVAE